MWSPALLLSKDRSATCRCFIFLQTWCDSICKKMNSARQTPRHHDKLNWLFSFASLETSFDYGSLCSTMCRYGSTWSYPIFLRREWCVDSDKRSYPKSFVFTFTEDFVTRMMSFECSTHAIAQVHQHDLISSARWKRAWLWGFASAERWGFNLASCGCAHLCAQYLVHPSCTSLSYTLSPTPLLCESDITSWQGRVVEAIETLTALCFRNFRFVKIHMWGYPVL